MFIYLYVYTIYIQHTLSVHITTSTEKKTYDILEGLRVLTFTCELYIFIQCDIYVTLFTLSSFLLQFIDAITRFDIKNQITQCGNDKESFLLCHCHCYIVLLIGAAMFYRRAHHISHVTHPKMCHPPPPPLAHCRTSTGAIAFGVSRQRIHTHTPP